jgi:ABC-type transport system involved in multi-copper enzyme maturation permease subunit
MGTPAEQSPDDSQRRWLGPLAVWELVRLARRGVPFRARLAVGGMMILALAGVAAGFIVESGLGLSALGFAAITQDQHAQLGERFAFAAVLAPLVAVILLAPGYAAAAVVEEKERRTLETLLATPLGDHEIVLDKFLARVALVLTLILAGLPVVMFVLPLGGGDPNGVVFGYAVTAGTAVLLVAIGIRAGCAASDLRGAAVRAYGWTAAYVLTLGIPCLWPFLSPLGLVVALYFDLPGRGSAFALVAVYPLIQVYAAAQLLRGAAEHLRREEDFNDAARRVPPKPLHWEPPRKEVEEPFDPYTEVPVPMFVRPGPKPPEPVERPVLLDDGALLWKEMHVTGRVPTLEDETARKVARVTGKGAGVAAAALILLGALSAAGGADFGRQLLLFGGTIAATAFAAAIGAAAAVSVARERRQKTLDALRALPVPRSDILAAKWLVCWERGPWWGPFGFIAVGMSFLAFGVPLMVAAVGLLAAGSFALVNGGLRLAVGCSEGVVARRLVGMVAAFAVAPVAAWYAADLSGDPGRVAVVVGGLAVVAAGLARLSWWRAVRELERGG